MVIDPGILKFVGEFIDGSGKFSDSVGTLCALGDEEISSDSGGSAEEVEDGLHEFVVSLD